VGRGGELKVYFVVAERVEGLVFWAVAGVGVFAGLGCCCFVGFGVAEEVEAFPFFKGEETFVCGGGVGGI
jgi:hypothetical protein